MKINDNNQFTKKINFVQEEWYKNGEFQLIEKYINCYEKLLVEMSVKKKVTILDVGGGAGYFVKKLAEKLGGGGLDFEIYLLDANRYDTWDDENHKIHYIASDVLYLNQIFTEKMFDYVFCNMFFHHLLSDNFKKSTQIREKCMGNIVNILKDDGSIGIIDNYNDGFIIDNISCRIIYLLTTSRNRFISKICQYVGSNSAGVGVCMLSQKMWLNLINMKQLKIVEKIDSIPDKFNIIKKIFLMNKSYSQFNLLILKKL